MGTAKKTNATETPKVDGRKTRKKARRIYAAADLSAFIPVPDALTLTVPDWVGATDADVVQWLKSGAPLIQPSK